MADDCYTMVQSWTWVQFSKSNPIKSNPWMNPIHVQLCHGMPYNPIQDPGQGHTHGCLKFAKKWPYQSLSPPSLYVRVIKRLTVNYGRYSKIISNFSSGQIFDIHSCSASDDLQIYDPTRSRQAVPRWVLFLVC